MDLWDILFRTLIVLTVLTVPIRIGVRVAQWGRRRAHEPPLARVWTHPLWLVYELDMELHRRRLVHCHLLLSSKLSI